MATAERSYGRVLRDEDNVILDHQDPPESLLYGARQIRLSEQCGERDRQEAIERLEKDSTKQSELTEQLARQEEQLSALKASRDEKGGRGALTEAEQDELREAHTRKRALDRKVLDLHDDVYRYGPRNIRRAVGEIAIHTLEALDHYNQNQSAYHVAAQEMANTELFEAGRPLVDSLYNSAEQLLPANPAARPAQIGNGLGETAGRTPA